MTIRWTRRALRRIDKIAGHVALYNAGAAERLFERLLQSGEALTDQPHMGRPGRYIGTRELVIEEGRYVVVYRVRGKEVQVVTVHDARRPWPDDWRDS